MDDDDAPSSRRPRTSGYTPASSAGATQGIDYERIAAHCERFDPSTHSVRDWLDNVEELAEEFGWDEARKLHLAAKRLAPTAKEWYRAWKLANPMASSTWEGFCDALRERWGVSDRELHSQLANCSQRRGETVREYSDRYLSLVTQLRIDYNRDPTHMHNFMRGLEPDIYDEVYIMEPHNLTAAIRKAVYASEKGRSAPHRTGSGNGRGDGGSESDTRGRSDSRDGRRVRFDTRSPSVGPRYGTKFDSERRYDRDTRDRRPDQHTPNRAGTGGGGSAGNGNNRPGGSGASDVDRLSSRMARMQLLHRLDPSVNLYQSLLARAGPGRYHDHVQAADSDEDSDDGGAMSEEDYFSSSSSGGSTRHYPPSLRTPSYRGYDYTAPEKAASAYTKRVGDFEATTLPRKRVPVPVPGPTPMETDRSPARRFTAGHGEQRRERELAREREQAREREGPAPRPTQAAAAAASTSAAMPRGGPGRANPSAPATARPTTPGRRPRGDKPPAASAAAPRPRTAAAGGTAAQAATPRPRTDPIPAIESGDEERKVADEICSKINAYPISLGRALRISPAGIYSKLGGRMLGIARHVGGAQDARPAAAAATPNLNGSGRGGPTAGATARVNNCRSQDPPAFKAPVVTTADDWDVVETEVLLGRADGRFMPIPAVVDTGASNTVVPRITLKRLSRQGDVVRSDVPFTNADGVRAPSCGLVRGLLISLGDMVCSVDAYVTEATNYGILLGSDFLAPIRADISYSRGLLEYTNDLGHRSARRIQFSRLSGPAAHLAHKRPAPTEQPMREAEEPEAPTRQPPLAGGNGRVQPLSPFAVHQQQIAPPELSNLSATASLARAERYDQMLEALQQERTTRVRIPAPQSGRRVLMMDLDSVPTAPADNPVVPPAEPMNIEEEWQRLLEGQPPGPPPPSTTVSVEEQRWHDLMSAASDAHERPRSQPPTPRRTPSAVTGHHNPQSFETPGRQAREARLPPDYSPTNSLPSPDLPPEALPLLHELAAGRGSIDKVERVARILKWTASHELEVLEAAAFLAGQRDLQLPGCDDEENEEWWHNLDAYSLEGTDISDDDEGTGDYLTQAPQALTLRRSPSVDDLMEADPSQAETPSLISASNSDIPRDPFSFPAWAKAWENPATATERGEGLIEPDGTTNQRGAANPIAGLPTSTRAGARSPDQYVCKATLHPQPRRDGTDSDDDGPSLRYESWDKSGSEDEETAFCFFAGTIGRPSRSPSLAVPDRGTDPVATITQARPTRDQVLGMTPDQHLTAARAYGARLREARGPIRPDDERRQMLLGSIDPTLPPDAQALLAKTLLDNYDLFAVSNQDLSVTDWLEATIDTGDAAPVCTNPYRLSKGERDALEAEVQKMLATGVIQHSSSEWCSPMVMVKKRPAGSDKAGGGATDAPPAPPQWRACIDLRAVNELTKPLRYPMPHVQTLIDTIGPPMGEKRIYSTMDLIAGFWQVPVRSEDRCKLAFQAPSGLYEFNVLPMGARQSPALFQRLLSMVLRPLLWYGPGETTGRKCCALFIDDICVASPDALAHAQHLQDTFDCLRLANLKMAVKKCHFATSKVDFLGHTIDQFGTYTLAARNADAIRNYPKLKTVRQIKAFLGLANYYRSMVPNFAVISRPLYDCLGKAGYRWELEQQEAFDRLKLALTTEPVLRAADVTRPFRLATDFSCNAVGACLSQVDDEGREYAVSYASKRLVGAETRWSSTDGEAYAAVWAVKKYHEYLACGRFELITDNSALTYITKAKDLTGKLARYALRLQGYDMIIVHRPGTRHGNVDGLSRLGHLEEDEEATGPTDHPPQQQDTAVDSPADGKLHLVGLAMAPQRARRLGGSLSTFLHGRTLSQEFDRVWSAQTPRGGARAFLALRAPPLAAEGSPVVTAAPAAETAALAGDGGSAAAAKAPHSDATTKAAAHDNAAGLRIRPATAAGFQQALAARAQQASPLLSPGKRGRVGAASTAATASASLRTPSGAPQRRRRLPCAPQHLQDYTEKGGSDSEGTSPKCGRCQQGKPEWNMLLCDFPGCEQAFHTTCLQPPLRRVPEGDWFCPQHQQQRAPNQGGGAGGGQGKGGLTPNHPPAAEGGGSGAMLSGAANVGGGPATTAADPLSPRRKLKIVRRHLPAAAVTTGRAAARDIHEGELPPTAAAGTAAADLQAGPGSWTATADPPEMELPASTQAHDLSCRTFVGAQEGAAGETKPSATTARAPPPELVAAAVARDSSDEDPEWEPGSGSVSEAEVSEDIIAVDGVPRYSTRESAIWADTGLLHYLQHRSFMERPDLTWNEFYKECARIISKARRYRWANGQLFRSGTRNRPEVRVLRLSERQQALAEVHGLAHPGARGTFDLCRSRFWWEGMGHDCKVYVEHCSQCHPAQHVLLRNLPLRPLPIMQVHHRVNVDLSGPHVITPRGNQYIIVAIDAFSKYPLVGALPNKESATTARWFWEHVVCHWGSVAVVMTDQGTEWQGQFAELLGRERIRHVRTGARCPQQNGQVERFMGVMRSALVRLCQTGEETEWDTHLPQVALSYRAARQRSTGCSPALLLYGRELTLGQQKPPLDQQAAEPGEDVDSADEGEQEVAEARRQAANARRSILDGAAAAARANMESAQERMKRDYANRTFKNAPPKPHTAAAAAPPTDAIAVAGDTDSDRTVTPTRSPRRPTTTEAHTGDVALGGGAVEHARGARGSNPGGRGQDRSSGRGRGRRGQGGSAPPASASPERSHESIPDDDPALSHLPSLAKDALVYRVTKGRTKLQRDTEGPYKWKMWNRTGTLALVEDQQGRQFSVPTAQLLVHRGAAR